MKQENKEKIYKIHDLVNKATIILFGGLFVSFLFLTYGIAMRNENLPGIGYAIIGFLLFISTSFAAHSFTKIDNLALSLLAENGNSATKTDTEEFL